MKNFPIIHHEHYKIHKERSKLLIFLRHFIFIVVIINLVFIGTIAIHEFGHFIVSKIYGCAESRIIYESNMLYTETLCRDSNNYFLLLGGIILPFLISIPLFLIGGLFIRDIAILMMGFNLIISFRDLAELGFSENIIFVFVFFGVLLLISGIIMLAKSRTEEHIHAIFDV